MLNIIKEQIMDGYKNALKVTIRIGDKEIRVTDWRDTWSEGDQGCYYGSDHKFTIKAGLFVYSGFGTGSYYSSSGRIFSCSTTEASMMAHEEGVDWKYIDSFNFYKAISVAG